MSFASRLSIAAPSVIAILLTFSSIVRADDKVVAPGACHLIGGLTTGLTYGAGHVSNFSGASLMVVCPIVRDNTTNTNGLQDLEVAVTDASGTMSCQGISVDRTGTILKSVGLTTPGTGNQIIGFASTVNVSVSKGHYQVVCTLPNNAAIHSIYYNEY